MAAVDRFADSYNDADKRGSLNWPFIDGEPVAPHDTNELAYVSRALYIGGAGAVKVTTLKGTDLTFAAVPVGTVLHVRAKKVFATGTTATNIVALQ